MQPRYQPGHWVFSGSTAFKFEPYLSDEATGKSLICIDAAEGRPNDYDWKNKIRVNVMDRELPQVIAVLLGWAESVEFKFHGQQKNKSYVLRHKNGELLIGVHYAQRRIYGKFEPHDRFYVTAVCLNTLARNIQMTHQATLDLIKHSQQFLFTEDTKEQR